MVSFKNSIVFSRSHKGNCNPIGETRDFPQFRCTALFFQTSESITSSGRGTLVFARFGDFSSTKKYQKKKMVIQNIEIKFNLLFPVKNK